MAFSLTEDLELNSESGVEVLILQLFLTLAGLTVFGYISYKANDIFQEIHKSAKKTQQSFLNFNRYLETHCVDEHLKHRAMKYLEYNQHEGAANHETTEQSLNCLSNYLKEEILKEVNLRLLRRLSIFKSVQL